MRAPLVALLALVALVGCGDEKTPFEVVSSAGASTVEEGTAGLSIEVEVLDDGGEVREEAATTGEGLIDFPGERALLTFEAAGQRFETAVDGTTVFLRGEQLGAAFGAGTEWVSFDFGRLLEEQAGADVAQFSNTADFDQVLGLLRGASEDGVEEVGTEEVRGEETTRYEAVVDLERAYEQNDAITDREQFQRFLDQLGDEDVPVAVWVDDDDRVRRLSFETPLPGAAGGGGAVRQVLEFFDFGTDEPIELPPAEDVTDVTEDVLAAAPTGG